MSRKSETNQLKKKLKLNTLLTFIFVLTGSAFFISAFASEGTRFDLYEFCFVPKQFTTEDSREKYCNKLNTYRGVTWLVALEYENSVDFKKVTLIRGIKANRPYTGHLGLASASFFLLSWLCWNNATSKYKESLHKIIREKEKEILEFAMNQDKGLELLSRKLELEKQFISTQQDKQHAKELYALNDEYERKYLAEKAKEQKETELLARELKHETIRAETEEQRKIRYEAALAALKAKSKISSEAWEEESENKELTLESLKSKLKEHEGGWLWELIDNKKPLWIIGAQGSWKSNLASALILARHLFMGWKLVSLCDTHFHQNSEKGAPWENLIPLEPECYGFFDDGNGFNWDSVEEAIQAAFVRWRERRLSDPIVMSLWDEVTNYSDNVPSTDSWALRLNSDPRKANEACIMLAHGKTKRLTGGGEGTKEAMLENCLFIRLGASNSQSPTFKGKLEGWKDENGEIVEDMPISIPKDWFNPQSIGRLVHKNKKEEQ